MGTGILSQAMTKLPWEVTGIQALAEGVWILNIVLFSAFSVMYLARWIIYFDEAKCIFSHSTLSMSFGTIPMGMATIINGLLVFGFTRWGPCIIPLVQTLWWVNVVMSLLSGVCIPYMMFTRQQHSIEKMTAVWLLPVVAAEVAAVSGGLMTPYISDVHTKFVITIISYLLWAYSVPVALSILVILFLRMALHNLPHENMAASCWLAIGPIGTGSLGMLIIGGNTTVIFAANNMREIGQIAQGIGFVTGIIFWGCGFWWMLLAVLITMRYFRYGIPFNLGWWGYTFPLGVYTVATLKLYSITNLVFFKFFGAMLFIILAVLWMLITVRTVIGALRGDLFVSP